MHVFGGILLKHFKGKLASIFKCYYFCTSLYKNSQLTVCCGKSWHSHYFLREKDLITLIINIFEKGFKWEKKSFKKALLYALKDEALSKHRP